MPKIFLITIFLITWFHNLILVNLRKIFHCRKIFATKAMQLNDLFVFANYLSRYIFIQHSLIKFHWFRNYFVRKLLITLDFLGFWANWDVSAFGMVTCFVSDEVDRVSLTIRSNPRE